ncbi:N-acetylglucosamine-specific PTS transporter subunit IIBC [Trueperella pyogenes]
MGGKTMEALQKLGRALMGAVAVMPVAAILMGIGYWIDPQGWGSGNILAAILIKAGAAVLDNLGWLFAIAIAFGLAKDHHGAAALSGFVGYATVKILISADAVASYQGVDIKTLEGEAKLDWISQGWNAINDKNVLIGILIGILAAWTYNKFHNTKLPDFLAFFSGRRLVPIMMTFFSMILALILYFVWPLLYGALFSFGQTIADMGAIGAGIYGFINRLLIPTGLHHAVNSIFWFDVIGLDDIGNFFRGGETITAAAAATSAATCPGVGIWDGSTCTVIGEVGRYQAGFFPVMMFGLPGAALAMYLRADSTKKKTAGALMFAGALASFFTGVTEPLEFAFMFVAPLLYLVHALLTGLSLFLAATFNWTAGFGFSAGFVDMFLSSRNPLANQWYMLLVLGVVYFAIYFGLFYLLIGALNLKTPGRGEDEPTDDVAAGPLNDRELAERIITGLGGPANIAAVDYCATRLRGTVKDQSLVDERALKATGVAGVVRPSAQNIQVVVGPNVQFVYDDVAALLRNTQASLKGEQEE